MSEQDVAKAIGKSIENLLLLHDMKQNELAAILKVSESTVGKWILGKSVPRMGTIQQIADYFKVPKSMILNGSDDNGSSISEYGKMNSRRRHLMDRIAKADDKKIAQLEKLMEIIDDEEGHLG